MASIASIIYGMVEFNSSRYKLDHMRVSLYIIVEECLINSSIPDVNRTKDIF